MNEDTQIHLFSSRMAGMNDVSWEGLADFCNTWVRETTEDDLNKLHEFVKAMRKKGIKDWDILMGRPVIIEVFHVLTENGYLTPNELADYATIPSQYLMDNALYYGEYQIIGKGLLPENPDYPIMYGQSISYLDRNKIIFQRGDVYKELPLETNKLIPGDFRNNGMGWQININAGILKECIAAGDNIPYWNRDLYYMRCDIRNPKHRKAPKAVLEQFGQLMCDDVHVGFP